jgi:hypothetical protein
VREFAYGADSRIGTFSDALMAEAKENAWMVISVKEDWEEGLLVRAAACSQVATMRSGR